jgi:pimeloyl-ACP methyl ester carboxylesterase
MSGFADQYYHSADGLRLHYRDYPGSSQRPPVLCLPGLTRNCRDFHWIACHLAPRFRVMAVDFRGRGQSAYDPNWQNYQPLTYAADVVALLDELGIARCICLGTSLGGLVGMIINHGHPLRLSALICNDVGPEIAPAGLARIRGYAGLSPPVHCWQDAARQVRETYGNALPGLSDEDWLAFARASYVEDAAGVPRLDYDANLGRALREVGGELFDPWALFAALRRLPLLVIHGVLSDILTPDIIERMRGVKPDLTLVEVPDRGHLPLLNEPACVAGIDRFLAAMGG